MAVGAVTSTNTTHAANNSGLTAATSGNGMNYDAFLKLLVAEMSNQDPLNPTPSTEYVAQFATFSSVEQAIQTNSKLDSMMAVSALTQADTLIGRTVTSADGLTSGSVSAVRVTTAGVEAVLSNGNSILLGNGTRVE
ncbi:flagellar hook assembly protein FlgD [Jiella marina]|uniref:flagellar hook assembly protein FlgD n=1 Tax=Jiella sp. LLJ827 TaxID=2917712 RepID=UPI0021008595|nr:flagellar hook assembly protein FlgD [Jiella sp. LLJ827]MCQ0988165.1 flagellar hook assembly protein FlgD [Jiella sp. LLJ827]